MIRKLIVGGVVACVLAAAPSALAGNVPRATLVKEADAICKADNATYAGFKHKPDLSGFGTWKAKQLKAAAGFFADTLALATSESTRISALGTPSEPAARKAWNRWHTLRLTYQLPGLAKLAAAAKKGDVAAFRAAFLSGDEKLNDEGAKLLKSLGIKTCEF